MDGGSIERLELKPGQAVTAAHVTQLDRVIAQNQGMRGTGVRRRQYPWGRTESFFGADGVGSSPIFQPDVSITNDGAEVRWDGPRSLIGGVAPTIAGAEIFVEDPSTLKRPALVVSTRDFSPLTGECRIYFRVTVGSDFRALVVEPVAFPSTPPVAAKTGYKLALFLRIRNGKPSYDEDADREMFCGQGFLAILQRASGKFESLWWATF